MSCMQQLIRDLGQANTKLAHQLARRRRLTRAESRTRPDSTLHTGEVESLLVASGSHGLLSAHNNGRVPTEENEPAAIMTTLSRRFEDSTRLFVNRLRSVPRWESLSFALLCATPSESTRLATMATDLMAIRFAAPLLRRLPQFIRPGVFPEAAGIMVTDSEGVIRLANHRLATLSGRELASLEGRPWLRTLVPEEDWPLLRRLPGFPRPAALRDRDVWIRSGQGRTFPVKMFASNIRHRGRTIGSVAVMVAEGTDQLHRMEDLANRERIYRRVFEEDVTGQYTCTPDGKLVSCNAAFARIFGFPSIAEALKCNLRQLHVSGAAADHFLDDLTRQRRLVYYESPMRRVDGRQIHVIRNVSGQFDANGTLREINGFIFDNTEHKQVEERVRQSQKMETVGRLAGGIAHDFNNLLLAIQGYASLLTEHVHGNSEGMDALEQIQKAADRAATLTRQLLAFSRRQVLQPRELNLNEVVRAMVPLLQRLVGEAVQLDIQLADDLGTVKADRAQIEEALVNLASNSRDAMIKDGRLVIATRNVVLRDTWFSFHDGPAPGDYVELTVQDNGTGMTDEVKAHLFEPFFTTKEQGKGTGLGLPTVYGIIKQSGGEVQAYSTLGEGTTIKILLPRMPASNGVERPPDIPAKPRQKRTLLVVEDEPPVRSLVKQILTREGFVVLDAGNPADALALIEQSQVTIHLLLTDLVMPGMSGRELWEHLCEHQPGLPVVYMSGYTEDTIIKHGVIQNRVNFLQKPFKPDSLIAKINEALDAA